MAKSKKSLTALFEKFSARVTTLSGRPITFVSAFLLVIIWGITGPFFHFSETWQLVINTGTTIITFLMVFLIQQSQNKDTMAIHLKLNELIASSRNASNRLVDIEDLTEEELNALKEFYCRLSDLAEEDKDIFATHSIDEASQNHTQKVKLEKR